MLVLRLAADPDDPGIWAQLIHEAREPKLCFQISAVADAANNRGGNLKLIEERGKQAAKSNDFVKA